MLLSFDKYIQNKKCPTCHHPSGDKRDKLVTICINSDTREAKINSKNEKPEPSVLGSVENKASVKSVPLVTCAHEIEIYPLSHYIHNEYVPNCIEPIYGDKRDKTENRQCYTCSSHSFWKLKDNDNWICTVCHPPIIDKDKIDWR